MSDFNQISVGNVMRMAYAFLSECSDSIHIPKEPHRNAKNQDT